MNFFGHDLLALMASHGYLLLFVIILAEEAGLPLPIPGDLLLLFTGSLVVQGVLGLVPTLIVFTVATLIGTSILYTVAFRGGRPLLHRYGRWLRLKEERVDRAERWLHNRPFSGVALLRLTPGLRIYSTMVAGLLAVPRTRATISFVVSGIVWAGAWMALGMVLGTNVNRAASLISRVDRFLVPALVAAATGIGLFWLGRRIYRRYLPDGLGLSARAMRLALVWKPRIRSVTVSGIVLALLLVAPPLVGAVHLVNDRTEHGASTHLVVAQAARVRPVADR